MLICTSIILLYIPHNFICFIQPQLLCISNELIESFSIVIEMSIVFVVLFRFQNDLEGVNIRENNKNIFLPNSKFISKTKSISSFDCHKEKSLHAQGIFKKSLRPKVLSRVFFEDYERLNKKILDPRGSFVQRWNKIFLVACLVSLFVDPLFFYLPVVSGEAWIRIQQPQKKLSLFWGQSQMLFIYLIFHSVSNNFHCSLFSSIWKGWTCNRPYKDCSPVFEEELLD